MSRRPGRVASLAKDEPLWLSTELSNVETVAIEVDFGERFAFPAGIEWWDAYVVWRGDKS